MGQMFTSGDDRPKAIVPTKAEAIDISTTDHLIQGNNCGIRVGTGGTFVAVLWKDSAEVTFFNVADGETLPYVFKEVKMLGTSCSNMIALNGE